MVEYHKLVRDRIPEIIEADGKTPVVRVIEDPSEIRSMLEKKLLEEFDEFRTNSTPEELADMLEVIFALGNRLGCSNDDLLGIMRQKRKERGGFKEGVFLERVLP